MDTNHNRERKQEQQTAERSPWLTPTVEVLNIEQTENNFIDPKVDGFGNS